MAKKDEESVEEEEDTKEEESSKEDDSDDEGGDDSASKKADKKGKDSEEEDEEADDKSDAEEDDSEDKGKGKGKSKKSEEDDAEPEIPVRKRIAHENIISRQKKTIKKLRKEEDDDANDDDESEEDEGGGKGKSVRKEVASALKPILDSLSSQADDNDLKDLYSDEPEAKQYDRAIRAYMKHPAYKGVAPAVIYHHLAYKKAEANGAKKKIVADTEAAKNKGGGNSKKPKGKSGSIPDVEELNQMSDKDFEALQDEVLQGKYKA